MIFAGAGDDVVEGNEGVDRINGDSGNDRLLPVDRIGQRRRPPDRIFGDDGDDLIEGQARTSCTAAARESTACLAIG
ncbi:MAG: hypothetical protein R3C99_00675 [Pirellulaceae bacterium]